MKGKLIVFEGIDGAGKATQVALLAKRLKKEGRRVTVFSIPRYKTEVGTLIKKALHGEYGDFRHLDPHLSAVPYFLDYALAKDSFLKALAHGDVIFDRYVMSTFAYHAAKVSKGKRAALIRELETIAFREIGLPKPDLIFYLDVPPKTSRALMRKRVLDQNEADTSYQQHVADTYKMLSEGKAWHVITCAEGGVMRSRAAIHGEVAGVLHSR